jgi:beta-glucosidase
MILERPTIVVSPQVTLAADPRLLARFDSDANQWRVSEGAYQLALGKSAGELVLTDSVNLTGRLFGR